MNYQQALDVLNAGGLMSRESWNGDGYRSYIFLVPGSEFVVNRAPLLGIFAAGTKITYRPHLDMVHADGTVGTWHAVGDDFMATDWMVITKSPVTGVKRLDFGALTPDQRQLWDEGRN